MSIRFAWPRIAVAITAGVIATSVAGFRSPPVHPATTLTYTTTDYAFTGPDAVDAGWVTLRIVNPGREPHQAMIVRLTPGKTLGDFMQAMGSGQPTPWATWLGGPAVAMPGGGEASTAQYLAPGNYVLLCVIPSPDGRPHVEKGMAKPLAVRAVMNPRGSAPRADLSMKLVDYGFELSRPVRAGRRTIRVWTDAYQPHEVVLLELAPGKSVGDFPQWVEGGMQGPPPARPLGGVGGLGPREVSYLTANFRRGQRYGLICFIPDRGDGRPHFLHGMIKEFAVE